jgi:HupE/UreJ protein
MRVDRRGALRVCLVFGLILSATSLVRAHTIGENYIWINIRQDAIDGRFEIHESDLRNKIAAPLEGKGAEALASARASAPKVQDYIRRHFSIAPEKGQPYALEFTREEVIDVPQGQFVQYFFRIQSGPVPDRLQIHHTMLYEHERLHRGLLLVENNEKTQRNYGAEHIAMVFGPAGPDQTLDLLHVPQQLHGRDMIWQGVLHIWLGTDHVLFLVALLLPTVLILIGSSWRPVPAFPRALWNVLKIVTVFTIAHSMTLLLAAFGVLEVPSRLVESMIALSIALVALNNLTGRVREASLLVILVLGLFHGLGFASVMGHLPFRTGDLVKIVVGFNIGVELGQMVIVALLFPALFLLRRHDLYMPVVLKGGSAILIVVSSAWFVQRALGLG